MKRNANTWDKDSIFSFLWLTDQQKLLLTKMKANGKNRDAYKFLYDLTGERLQKVKLSGDPDRFQARVMRCKKFIDSHKV